MNQNRKSKAETTTVRTDLAKLPVMGNGNQVLTVEQLKNKERWLENEIEALQHSLSKVQKEIFYKTPTQGTVR